MGGSPLRFLATNHQHLILNFEDPEKDLNEGQQ
jgi:hypothetical protein